MQKCLKKMVKQFINYYNETYSITTFDSIMGFDGLPVNWVSLVGILDFYQINLCRFKNIKWTPWKTPVKWN